ncbi:hypothetical protein BpHYR1_009627 [Brachionus plicatilis]|uniref:Uncharacterized protein n=1 Tax=Brachionus plicatilis TaxID=10195 RepID=A0A3M7SS04_BRAPC|nr:hypothetical protein BpHYR1_009627 [Brachionus plicatilis]
MKKGRKDKNISVINSSKNLYKMFDWPVHLSIFFALDSFQTKKTGDFTNSSEFVEIEKINFVDELSYESILQRITFGSYQLKQSLSYIAEHFEKIENFK